MPGALKQTYFKIELNDYKRPDLKKKDLTPLNLAEFNIKYNPNYPVAIFADISGKNHPNYYVTWKEVGNAIDLVSKYLLNIFKETSDNGIVEIPRVIGILAPGDPQAYFIVLLGIMKIGSIPFAMSTRNSPAALAHLLQKTNCRNLLVPFDPVKSGNPSEQFSRDQVKGMLEIIPLEHAVCLKRMPNTFDLIPGLISEEKRFETGGILHLPEEVIPTTLNENEVPDNKTLLILHSSGSTKFPKPIYLTRATLRAGMNVQNFTNFHFKGQISCALALPPFHSMYYHVGFYPVLYDGTISGYFRPELTPDGECQNPNINSVTIMEAMKKLNCTVASFSPSILTEYAEDPSCVKFLSGMERVAYGGGPLRTDVGDLLARSGVKLSPMYGMTETGCIAEFFPLPRSAEQWEYFSFARHITPQLVPRGNNEYELVLLSSQNHRSSEEVEGQELTFQAFQTKDLLAKHPTLPLYRVIGRLDDQIMLSTSEKTNPGPLEAILCFNRSIAAALIFGRAKPQNGVIIEPSSGHEVDIKDSNAVEKYIDEIWPSFEDLNKFAPSHSRITRDFIVIIDPRVSPLPRTPKGGVARAKALEMFENEIEAIYLNSGRGLSLNSSAIKICDDQGRVSAEKTLSAIKTLIEETIGQSIKQEVDIFKHGCDSLSASQIRSKVLKICQENSTLEVFVPQNVVYQNPTAELLSNWVFHLLSNSNSAAPEIYQEFSVALNNLNSMINKHKPNASKVILITGTTGSLGSYVLDDILKNRDVKNVYALNRSHARSESEHQRHVNSFRERGLEVATLDDSRITFLSSNTIHDLPFEVRLE
ncbi:hypothetical protein BY996DRAFT_3658912 [Phakopsora pachyrhizi]|nr:hypothetical protein BY996DRAFT_3658912 [Phakopsora pachyrhizi]